MQNRKTLLIAVAAGIVAMTLLWSYLAARERALLELAEPVPVVIAIAEVPRGSVVLEHMVQLADTPRKYLQPGAVTSLDEVVGRRLAIGLRAGAQVVAAHLSGVTQPSLSFLVPTGERAVTLAVDDVTGVAGLVQPGDAVDVLGVFEVGPAGERAQGQPLVRTLLQNITVLATDSDAGSRRLAGPIADGPTEDDSLLSAASAREEIKNVTLLLDSEQAQRLVLAQHLGALTLVLRAGGDRSMASMTSTSAREVTGVEAPTRRPAAPVWRELRDQR